MLLSLSSRSRSPSSRSFCFASYSDRSYCLRRSLLRQSGRAIAGISGALAERYVREFDAKWLRGGAPPGEPLVGSSDIQSLADLNNSFEVVRTMGVPITKAAFVQLVAATLAPVAPLVLTMMPLKNC